MVRITHKPRLPSLKRFTDPWFESALFPFSRMNHPWFRLDPIDELDHFWGDYLDYMERYFRDVPETLRKFTTSIRCDLADKGDRFVVTADLPGMEKDEVDINILDSELEIFAEHKESKEEKKEDYISKERSQVRYRRTIALPDEIIGSKVTAKMANGILTIDLPKKNPAKTEEPLSVKIQ